MARDRRHQAVPPHRKGSAASMRHPVAFLPKDTCELVSRWIHDNEISLHPGLLAQRFLAPHKNDRSNKVDGRQTYKRVASNSGPAVAEYLQALKDRTSFIAQSLRSQGFIVHQSSVRVGWRLAIGLGSEHPAGVGSTLHRGGFPYLPATGLKGMTREVARSRLSRSEVDRLFGTTSEHGAVFFFDALPERGAKSYLELDVMNPHVAKFYRQIDWPRPWDNPIPLWFLAVPTGVCFHVLVAARVDQDAQTTMNLLLEGLRTHGIGAKRAAGYGWLEVAKDAP